MEQHYCDYMVCDLKIKEKVITLCVIYVIKGHKIDKISRFGGQKLLGANVMVMIPELLDVLGLAQPK